MLTFAQTSNRFMKNLFLVTLVLFLSSVAIAQDIQVEIVDYERMDSGTVIYENGVYLQGANDVPFPFTLNRTFSTYDSVSYGSGSLEFTNYSTGYFYAISFGVKDQNTVILFEQKILQKVTGSAPYRVFEVEFQNLALSNYPNEKFDVRISLYEESDAFKYHFNTSRLSSFHPLNNDDCSFYFAEVDLGLSNLEHVYALTGDPQNPVVVKEAPIFPDPLVLDHGPANNTLYTFDGTTSVSQMANPANFQFQQNEDRILVQSNTENIQSVRLLNLQGKVVQEKSGQSTKMDISIIGVAHGLYLVNIQSNGKTHQRKVVI
ncbi:MAG: hypothetical protein ACI9YL_001585 [Luteibaculaceae bacterium]|jgi:hypothetical protein